MFMSSWEDSSKLWCFFRLDCTSALDRMIETIYSFILVAKFSLLTFIMATISLNFYAHNFEANDDDAINIIDGFVMNAH